MVISARQDWRLVAPWYRWELADGSEPERALHADRPALHKYATVDFVDDFLDDPQISVEFDDGRDYLTASAAGSAGVVKLFQPAHSRLYLVAVELHCTEPGFPNVDPARVTEAGFVVRRTSGTTDGNDAAGSALARRRIQHVATRRLSIGRDVMRRLHPFRSIPAGRVVDRGRAASAASARAITADRQLALIDSTRTGEQGWVPTGEGTVGAWLPMLAEPDEVAETVYPMQALRPNPDDPDHAALDGTIFFGLVPTAGDEVTVSGKNRFGPGDEYVIHAFVRVDRGGCPGLLIWSKPSHPFGLAAFLDPEGAAQRPVEIAMPDLEALRTSMALPSVRVSSPPGSSFPITGRKDVPGGIALVGDAQVCFHSIALITIVATFVLNIFMPIVIWIFQLWWMLGLKFCFPRPPSAATVDPRLNTVGGIQGAANVDLETALSAAQKYALRTALETYFGALYDDADEIVDTHNNDLNELVAIMAAQGHGRPNDGWPTYAGGLTYTTRVRRDDVKEPWPP